MALSTSRSGLRFTHLTLRNWRNFSACDVQLGPRAFLVGPNASGKSNLLDVFRFLHDIVSVGGGLQKAVRDRGGVSSLRSLHARRHPGVSIDVVIGTDERPQSWRYRLDINKRSRNDDAVVEVERVWRNGTLVIERPNKEDQRDRQRLSQTVIEQIAANADFREVAAFFQSVRYLHVSPQFIRDPLRATRSADAYGGDLIRVMAETPEKTRKARLKRIEQGLQIAVPQIGEIQIDRDAQGVPHIKAKYRHWRPQGAWQNEERFSDGTLRLLGLLWALQEPGGPLLLEEPELSLHPAVTRLLPTVFARVQRRGGQILMTTQSDALLMDEGIGLDEVFLMVPRDEGTEIVAASSLSGIRDLLTGGSSLPEVILPHTAPRDVRQLSLLDL